MLDLSSLELDPATTLVPLPDVPGPLTLDLTSRTLTFGLGTAFAPTLIGGAATVMQEDATTVMLPPGAACRVVLVDRLLVLESTAETVLVYEVREPLPEAVQRVITWRPAPLPVCPPSPDLESLLAGCYPEPELESVARQHVLDRTEPLQVFAGLGLLQRCLRPDLRGRCLSVEQLLELAEQRSGTRVRQWVADLDPALLSFVAEETAREVWRWWDAFESIEACLEDSTTPVEVVASEVRRWLEHRDDLASIVDILPSTFAQVPLELLRTADEAVRRGAGLPIEPSPRLYRIAILEPWCWWAELGAGSEYRALDLPMPSWS